MRKQKVETETAKKPLNHDYLKEYVTGWFDFLLNQLNQQLDIALMDNLAQLFEILADSDNNLKEVATIAKEVAAENSHYIDICGYYAPKVDDNERTPTYYKRYMGAAGYSLDKVAIKLPKILTILATSKAAKGKKIDQIDQILDAE